MSDGVEEVLASAIGPRDAGVMDLAALIRRRTYGQAYDPPLLSVDRWVRAQVGGPVFDAPDGQIHDQVLVQVYDLLENEFSPS